MPSIFEYLPDNPLISGKKKRIRFQIPSTDKSKVTRDAVMVDLIEMDATLKETHTYTTEISDNPLEDGTFVTDHANIKPREISIECFVANNPLTLTSALIGNTAGLVGSIVGRATGSDLFSAIATGGLASIATRLTGIPDGPGTRVNVAIQKMVAAWEGASLITVVNGLTAHKNMVITNMVFNRDKQTADVLSLTVTLKEVRVVTGRTIDNPKNKLKKFIQPTGTTPTDKGRQPQVAPTPQQSGFFDTLKNGGSIAKAIGNIF